MQRGTRMRIPSLLLRPTTFLSSVSCNISVLLSAPASGPARSTCWTEEEQLVACSADDDAWALWTGRSCGTMPWESGHVPPSTMRPVFFLYTNLHIVPMRFRNIRVRLVASPCTAGRTPTAPSLSKRVRPPSVAALTLPRHTAAHAARPRTPAVSEARAWLVPANWPCDRGRGCPPAAVSGTTTRGVGAAGGVRSTADLGAPGVLSTPTLPSPAEARSGVPRRA